MFNSWKGRPTSSQRPFTQVETAFPGPERSISNTHAGYDETMNLPRWTVTLSAGFSAALLTYSAFYVRGDTGAVMAYLRERARVRRFADSGAVDEQVREAQRQLAALGAQIAAPAQALEWWPVACLVGLTVAALVWWLYGRRAVQPLHAGQLERMVLRLAYRKGGAFTLQDLLVQSPLTPQQAQEVTDRLTAAGRLRAQQGTFEVVRS